MRDDEYFPFAALRAHIEQLAAEDREQEREQAAWDLADCRTARAARIQSRAASASFPLSCDRGEMSRWGVVFDDSITVNAVEYRYRAVAHFPSPTQEEPAPDVEPDAVLCLECEPDPRAVADQVREKIIAQTKRARRYHGGQGWPLENAWSIPADA